MSDYVRGGGAPNLAALKLKKAAAKSVVTDIASSPAEPETPPARVLVPPQAVAETPAQPAAPPPDHEPQQSVQAAPEPAAQPAQATVQTPAAPSPEPDPAPAPAEAPADPDDKLIKTSIRHKASKAKRLRATYIATMRFHRKRSLSDWLSDVLDAECTRMEELYNDGQPFDEDPELPKGRPLSS